MSIVKRIAGDQYRSIVNKAYVQTRSLQPPKEGWLATTRKSLGMSAAQLARRLGVTRAQVSRTEKAELSGGVTIKTMQSMAKGMGCRFVYAIVPEGTVEDVLAEHARRKAGHTVFAAGKHAALEGQALSKKQMLRETERLQNQLLQDMPKDFWNEEGGSD